MKKKTAISLFAACALLLSGCAQNGGNAASTTTTAQTSAAASTSAAETTTTAAATEATTTAVSYPKADISTQTRLFRGYVETDKAAEYLFVAPDESSEQLSELTYGMILEIYTCDHDGWYVAELGGETVGYVKADIIRKYPHTYPFGDPLFGGYVASDSAIKLYGEADESSDVLREIDSGTQIEIYECETEGWYMTAIAKADGTDEYDVGYVKAENIAEISAFDMDGSEGEPNEYGFYPFPDPPASSISVASLSGTWYDENSVIVIKEGSDLYNGTFLLTDSTGTSEGYIKLEYALNPDDTKTFWFTFYKNDGTLWNAFGATGDIPLNDLYAGQSGEPHLVRRVEAYITDIVGVWNEADVLDSRTLTVNEDGTFKLEYRGGGTLSGTVKIEYEDHPDGSQTAWFIFYEEDGKMWDGFQRTNEEIMNDLYSGHTGEPHFVRAS